MVQHFYKRDISWVDHLGKLDAEFEQVLKILSLNGDLEVVDLFEKMHKDESLSEEKDYFAGNCITYGSTKKSKDGKREPFETLLTL